MKCNICGATLKREYDMFRNRMFVCPVDSKHTQKGNPKNKIGNIFVR